MSVVGEGYLDQLQNFANNPSVFCDELNWGTIEKPFEIAPEDFIQYAEVDLQSNLAHRHINALSNAKRALDCQLDCILDSLGLLSISRRRHWGFPRKLQVLEEIGILTPRILNKINRMRNLLEHEFQRPAPDAIVDALDTVNLFVVYTNSFFRQFPFSMTLALHTEDEEYNRRMKELVEKGSADAKLPKWSSGAFALRDTEVHIVFNWDDKTISVESLFDGDETQLTLRPQDEHFLFLFKLLKNFTLG